jgi:hypothetical protein
VSFSELENDTLNQAELNEIKINENRHQFHVFQTFLHRLLGQKRVRRLGFSFSPGTSNI